MVVKEESFPALDGEKFFVYILRCADGTLYTGWTTDIGKRLLTHNRGKGAKYTRSRLPVVLVYLEEVCSQPEALRREAALKKLSRKEKLSLIEKTKTEPAQNIQIKGTCHRNK